MELSFTDKGKTTEGDNLVGMRTELGENKSLSLAILFEISTRNKSKVGNKLLQSSI